MIQNLGQLTAFKLVSEILKGVINTEGLNTDIINTEVFITTFKFNVFSGLSLGMCYNVHSVITTFNN